MDWRPIETLPDNYIFAFLVTDGIEVERADIESVTDQVRGYEIVYYRVTNEGDEAKDRVFRGRCPWTHWCPITSIPLPDA